MEFVKILPLSPHSAPDMIELRVSSGSMCRQSMEYKSFLNNRLDIAMDFIIKNTSKRITVEDISAEAAISKFHLIRSFKKQFGITPIQLHLLCKIDRAKEMLSKNPGLKIKDVAALMGYPDVFSFSKYFKKITGSSPRDFPMAIQKSKNLSPTVGSSIAPFKLPLSCGWHTK